MNDECKYYRELEEQYDELPEKLSDEDIEQLQCEQDVSDETLAEMYRKLEEWDEDKHLLDF